MRSASSPTAAIANRWSDASSPAKVRSIPKNRTVTSPVSVPTAAAASATTARLSIAVWKMSRPQIARTPNGRRRGRRERVGLAGPDIGTDYTGRAAPSDGPRHAPGADVRSGAAGSAATSRRSGS